MANTVPDLPLISDFPTYWALRTPKAPALSFQGSGMCYAALAEAVDRWARAMIAAGVTPGDRVAILSTPRPEAWLSFLAAAAIGAVWLGINPRHTTGEIRRVLDDAQPGLAFALEHFEGAGLADALKEAVRLSHAQPAVVTFGPEGQGRLQGFLEAAQRVGERALARRREAVAPDDAALIVYTSGSTGTPKGALLSHRAMVLGYTSQTRHFRLEGMRVICNLPISHIACVGDLCSGPLVGGGAIVFMERFEAQAMLGEVAAGRVDTILTVPSVLQMMCELPDFDATDFSHVRLVCWGGAALSPAVLARLRAKGCPLGTVYGMTELPGSITMSSPGASDDELTGSVGYPAPGVELKIAGDGGAPLPPGEAGEICLRHPGLMLEYFRRPAQTAAAFDAQGFYKTGDIGRRDPDGRLALVGRSREMFKSGGYNVYPREIEKCLEDSPLVDIAAVIGVPDPLYQEVGHAFVVPAPDAPRDGLVAAIEAWARQHLSNYKRPKRIILRDSLPMLPIGKVDKRALGRMAEREGGAPDGRGPVETKGRE